jgi:hypothetical protein
LSAATYAVKRADDGRYADGHRGWTHDRVHAFHFAHVAGMLKTPPHGALECGAADHAETFDGDVTEAGEPLDVYVVRINGDAEERVALPTSTGAE